MTNIPGLSGCGGGAFNDGTVALKFLRCSLSQSRRVITSAEVCCGLFKRDPHGLTYIFFKKLNCYA